MVLDQCSRRVLAWRLTRTRTARVTCAVLSAAARRRRGVRGVIFHTLKAELTRGVVFADERQRRTAIRSYIHYYNTTRLHSSLN